MGWISLVFGATVDGADGLIGLDCENKSSALPCDTIDMEQNISLFRFLYTRSGCGICAVLASESF